MVAILVRVVVLVVVPPIDALLARLERRFPARAQRSLLTIDLS